MGRVLVLDVGEGQGEEVESSGGAHGVLVLGGAYDVAGVVGGLDCLEEVLVVRQHLLQVPQCAQRHPCPRML